MCSLSQQPRKARSALFFPSANDRSTGGSVSRSVRVGIFKRRARKGDEVESTDVNFQVLRRTCATLFGAIAKDPRDTQAQLRHADPSVTLRHYQKSIPASVRAAAVALETELIGRSGGSI